MEHGRIISVELFVNDLDVSTRFYSELLDVLLEEDTTANLGAPSRLGRQVGRTWHEGATASFVLTQAGDGPPTTGAGLRFWVDDLDAKDRQLRERGVPVQREPFTTPGATVGSIAMATYLDPDGNLVTLIEVPGEGPEAL